MALVRDEGTLRPGMASDVTGWLVVIVSAGLVLAMCAGRGDDSASRSEEGDHPFAEVGRSERDAPVCSVAFAPVGTMLASCTFDGGLQIEDTRTRCPAWSGLCRFDTIPSLQFSADGRVLAATGVGAPPRLVDAGTGADTPGPSFPAKVIAFSGDGRTLAAGRFDGDLALWDRRNSRTGMILRGHRGWVNALDFSPDGRRLASGGVDGTTRIWDIEAGRELIRLDDPAHRPLDAVRYAPGGGWLATARSLGTVIRLWDPETGAWRLDAPAGRMGIRAIAFSPRGRLLAIARGDGDATFFDLDARRVVGRVRAQGREFLSLAFSADGRILATGGRDGCVRLWDVRRALGLTSGSGPTAASRPCRRSSSAPTPSSGPRST